MEISYACEPSPDAAANEDFVLAGPGFGLVLDGATPSGLPTGCVHDVPWFVARLGAQLAQFLVTHPREPLPEILRQAILRTRDLHPECDLGNPETPASTVALFRADAVADRLDCLVLADSPVVVRRADGRIELVEDTRIDHLPAYDPVSVSALRNAADGFWVASTSAEAAEQAVTASFPLAGVREVAAMSDGVSRLVERFGWTWTELLDSLAAEGPAHAVAAVRKAELALRDGAFRGKRHDDATVLLARS
ncbi:protein phosphatase 2C domain-containing protein [Streptacidiphilus rugosus]|uniref:protein phosphatase 2C domain-containing protein n=1 Tax=Streptacidiphilus rugosus TaxID=405783 RepID=UPI00056870C6|nr:protein phosphatase 2C domain-containing protein [Streptacidiphilus rugosus]